MTDDAAGNAVESAIATARVRALRAGLLDLHKTLLDIERARFERLHGRFDNAHDVLKAVLEDPAFAWLRVVSSLVIRIDERAADKAPLGPADVSAFADQIHALLVGQVADDGFRAEYQRALQEAPDAVVAHARVQTLLSEYRRR
jgi:hypothetical protein